MGNAEPIVLESVPEDSAHGQEPGRALLREYWYIAAESAELRDRPISRVLHGERVVLFRGGDAKARALLDRCAHRNMALSLGRVVENCVECPYHGWRYDGAGACVHVPSLCNGARLPGIALRSFPVIEQEDYVWVFMGASTPGRQPFQFPGHRERGWTSFRMKTLFAGSVEACLENFLDCPHTVFVHKGWFRTRDTRQLTAVIRRRRESVEAEFQNEPISDSVVSRLLFPKRRELRHTDRFIMPNISRVDYDFGPDRHFIITSQCTPLRDGETEVYTVISYRFGHIGSLVRLFFEPLCRRIIKQDVDMLRAQTEQLRTFGGPRFAQLETDLLALQIQSLRAGEKSDDRERTISIRF